MVKYFIFFAFDPVINAFIKNLSNNPSIIKIKYIEQRKAKGMTQKELAQATSLTQSVIARMESKKAVPQHQGKQVKTLVVGAGFHARPNLKY